MAILGMVVGAATSLVGLAALIITYYVCNEEESPDPDPALTFCKILNQVSTTYFAFSVLDGLCTLLTSVILVLGLKRNSEGLIMAW